MKRRHFLINGGVLALGAGLASPSVLLNHPTMPTLKLIKPARIKPGATISLIAPASPPAPEKFEKTFENLELLGFKMKLGASVYAKNGHLAGSDAERLADLHQAFSDPETDAIWCVRGGYGCTRLLDAVDYDLIRRHPKPFIGYSDVTALHLAIHGKTGLVTFHGPVGASDFPEDTLHYFRSTLMEPEAPLLIAAPKPEAVLDGEAFMPFVIHPGIAKGVLTGGNLALLSAMTGTAFLPSFKNKLVFIEDIGEQPYRIDRMLTQLLMGTDLKQAAGIVLGVFNDCQPKSDASLSLRETLQDRLGGLGIPVQYGIPFGHITHMATLPYGILAELDTNTQTLRLLEKAVL